MYTVTDTCLLAYTYIHLQTNVNLGDGLNVDTGRFTVPTSGVYMFLLNVYGAPRDPVALSIKLVKNLNNIFAFILLCIPQTERHEGAGGLLRRRQG